MATYEKLDWQKQEIRLLRFDSWTDAGAVLKCTCETVSLINENSPQYFAISYVWGDAPVRRAIQVDGEELHVPESADSALRELQNVPLERIYPDETIENAESKIRRFWIDAICINQSDLDERAEQVKIMHKIYSKASATLVRFCGDGGGHVRAAFDSVEKICFDPEGDTKARLESLLATIGTQDMYGRRQWTPTSGSLPSDLNWPALQALYSNPWFGRIWTVQESHLNRITTVIWAGHSCSYSAIRMASHLLAQKTYEHCNPFGRFPGLEQDMIRGMFSGFDPNQISEILPNVHRFKATDTRDMVYGVTALFSSFASTVIDASYRRSLKEVYARATVAAIVSSGLLGVLSKAMNCIVPDDEHRDDFPSWAIKCHWQYSVEELPTRIFSKRRPEHCKADFQYLLERPERMPLHEWRILPVRGMAQDVIEEVSEIINNKLCSDVSQFIVFIKQYYLQMLSSLGEIDKHEVMFRVVDALVHGSSFENTCLSKIDATTLETEMIQLAEGLVAIFEAEEDCPDDKPMIEPSHPIAVILNRALTDARNRRMFRTRKGWLGRGMPDTKVGDVICDLTGGEVLYVARPHGKFYKLVGDCTYGNQPVEPFKESEPTDSKSAMLFQFI